MVLHVFSRFLVSNDAGNRGDGLSCKVVNIHTYTGPDARVVPHAKTTTRPNASRGLHMPICLDGIDVI